MECSQDGHEREKPGDHEVTRDAEVALADYRLTVPTASRYTSLTVQPHGTTHFGKLAAGVVLLRAIEPVADERLPVDEGAGGVGSGPFEDAGHEPGLDRLGQDVLQALALTLPVVADGHGAVAAAPELLGPLVEPADLTGDVGVEVTLEPRHLEPMLSAEQEVVVLWRASSYVELTRSSQPGGGHRRRCLHITP